MHPRLAGFFTAEPRVVDARAVRHGATRRDRETAFGAVLADVAAAVREVDKDTINGAHLTIQRRAIRRRSAAIVVLSVLVVLALVASVIA